MSKTGSDVIFSSNLWSHWDDFDKVIAADENLVVPLRPRKETSEHAVENKSFIKTKVDVNVISH